MHGLASVQIPSHLDSHERQSDPRPCWRRDARRPNRDRMPARSTHSSAAPARWPSSGNAGRLILALDATMSRQPTWDLACSLQGEMFDAVAQGRRRSACSSPISAGSANAGRRPSSRDTDALKRLMTGIDCRGGHTQIGKVLAHALAESKRGKVGALVYIGDAMEERADDLAAKAGELGLHGVPVFVFQEGRDGVAERSLQGDRAPVERRVVPLRPQFGGHAGEAAVGRRGVCVRRPQGAGGARPRRRPADDRVTARRTQMIDVVIVLRCRGCCCSSPSCAAARHPLRRRSACSGRCCSASPASRSSASARPAPAASWWRQRWPGSPRRIWRAASRSRRPPAARWCAPPRWRWNSTTRPAGWKGWCSPDDSEGKTLGKMSEAELVALYRELGGDFESRQLLETYLDGRFPVWRQRREGGRWQRAGRRARFWRHD